MTKIQTASVLVCFGSKFNTFTVLQNDYPDFSFKRLNQTHSNNIINAESFDNEAADAQYTDAKNSALVVATADCLPIMCYCKQSNRVAAIHAGWKGLENLIVVKTLEKLVSTGSTNKDFYFWVGPHIQQESFEVKEDVFLRLKKADLSFTENFYLKKNDRFYIDLNKILISQIEFCTGSKAKIDFLDIDTKKNSNYHSYRRNSETKERNYSFICLLT